MLRITVDTNILGRDLERMAQSCEGLDVQIAPTTVTLRERLMPLPDPTAIPESGVYDESTYDSGAVYAGAPVYETLTLDESVLGAAVLGDEESPFEEILRIISDGSFPRPGQREELSKGQRRQLRDAMILEAHAREGRDVLVSNDRTAFIGKTGEKRPRLEEVCRTRILTVDEFCDEIARLVVGRASSLSPFVENV